MNPAGGFLLFGPSHLVTLALVAACGVTLVRMARLDHHHRLAAPFAAILVVHEVFKVWLFVGVDGQRWVDNLPLDLCRLNALLCAYLLVRRSYRVFEISYFWAMAGSLSAILTPDLQAGFPDVRYFSFFAGHAGTILAALYAIHGYGFRPSLNSLGRALMVTALYAAVVAALNPLLDSNYLFLRAKPEGASVLDLFGPWPYYLFGLVALAVVACTLSYLPFASRRPGSTESLPR